MPVQESSFNFSKELCFVLWCLNTIGLFVVGMSCGVMLVPQQWFVVVKGFILALGAVGFAAGSFLSALAYGASKKNS